MRGISHWLAQLTHSGRYFTAPNDAHTLVSRTAYAHPLLDQKFGNGPENVVSDSELAEIIQAFVRAAAIARDAGFDFVDIKHAHGYLGHELLSAYDRPGKYGGSFENRTRFFKEIAEDRGEMSGFPLSPASAFRHHALCQREDGVGVPRAWEGERYPTPSVATGGGLEMDENLRETHRVCRLNDGAMEVSFICATVGSPYTMCTCNAPPTIRSRMAIKFPAPLIQCRTAI